MFGPGPLVGIDGDADALDCEMFGFGPLVGIDADGDSDGE